MKNLVHILITLSFLSPFPLSAMNPPHRRPLTSYELMLARFLLKNAEMRQTSESPHILRCLLLGKTYLLEKQPAASPTLATERDSLVAQLTAMGYSPNFFCYKVLRDNKKNLESQRTNLKSKKTRADQKLVKLQTTKRQERDRQARGGLTQRIIEQHLTRFALEYAEEIVVQRQRRRDIIASPEYQRLQENWEHETRDNIALQEEVLEQKAVIKRLVGIRKQLEKKPKMVDQSTQTD